MYKFKTKLLYNQEKYFFTKNELSNFKINLPLTKLIIVRARLVSNGLIFSGDTSAYI